jgi:glycosyltransferase involved in cell wall biosynthesis
MRVIFLSASGELGGAERSLLDVVDSLRKARPEWQLHLVVPAEGTLLRHATEAGVHVALLPYGDTLSALGESGDDDTRGARAPARRLAAALLPAARYARRLRAHLRAVRPDLVHSNGLKMHLLAAWTAPPGAPVVWHVHDYIGSRPLTSRLLRASVGRCAAIVTNSASVAEDARRVLGARAPIVAIPNAIDLDRFSPEGPRLDLDGLAGLPPAPPSTIRVGLVATYGRWKGHTTFLDALARLPGDVSARGYIVGGSLYRTSGSQLTRKELEHHAASVGVADRVGFTGFVEQPDQALRALDIVVHASTAPEPFGLVIAEAMACGRAVIASDAGGPREIVTPGVDGLLREPGNPESLADGIARLARDPGARARLGRAGRETAERQFDRARLAAALVPVYERARASMSP